ncbi:MAG TPA: thiamine phosphate synthase, partial [Planctomycetes bacterium]|nr:thiamine phosphate synthase [Planctomycetota bacterium]
MKSEKNRSVLRAIDANANRCREGLRVAEDYARFILDDGGLAGRLKEMRHQVTETVRALADEPSLAGARDTEGDVGTTISVPQEVQRVSEEDVLKSALKRAEEALRVLEEFGKMV